MSTDEPGLGDRLGELDDRSAIYRSGMKPSEVRYGKGIIAAVIGAVVAVGLIAVLGALVGEGTAAALAFILSLAFVVAYIIWRRRRNERLTGSPTTWPT